MRIPRPVGIAILLITSLTLSVAVADLVMEAVEAHNRTPFYTNLTPSELAKLPVVTSGTISGAYVDDMTDLAFHEPGTSWRWAGQRQGTIEFLVKGRWNNIGCHDDVDYPYSDRPAVLFLGDSFVEAMQVDVRETFYGRLRNGALGRRFDTWACGVAGGHPSSIAAFVNDNPRVTELPALKRISTLRPRYVVYFVYMGNDLRDGAGPWYEDAEKGDPACASRVEPSGSFLLFRIRQVADMYFTHGGADVRCMNNSFWPYVRSHVPAVEEGWRVLFEGLDSMNRTIAARGGKLLLAMVEPFPAPYGDFALQRAIRANYPGGKAVPLDMSLPRTRLNGFASARGLSFIDLSEGLRGCGGQDHYYPSDSHFNVKGHRCVAAYLDAHEREWFP